MLARELSTLTVVETPVGTETMWTGRKILLVAKILVLAGLVLVVLVQVNTQVGKYASKQKTIAKTSKFYESLLLPAMTFCLGFKVAKVRKLPWLLRYADGTEDGTTFPKTREEAEALWDEITLSVEDVKG